MNSLLNTIRRYIRIDPPKALGRWKIIYCVKKTDSKVDLANEDHCGTCGQYAVQKISETDKGKEQGKTPLS